MRVEFKAEPVAAGSADGRGRSRAHRIATTERRVIAAARELFLRQGYQDTTLAAVAAQAGVGARTVYLRFGSKGAVLLRVVADAIDGAADVDGRDADDAIDGAAGADDRHADGCQADGRNAGDAPDGITDADRMPGPRLPTLTRFAREARLRYEHLGPLVDVMQQAAATEPFVAQEVVRQRVALRRASADVVSAVADRDDGATADAVEAVAALAAPQIYHRVVGELGWAADRYEAWLAAHIERLIR